MLLLLKCGITWKDFSELAKGKFVKVASDAFGIRGRPTNISRVAILTGLDRREVAKLRRSSDDERTGEQGFMSKPAQVLQAWFHDSRFLDRSGKPRDLEIEGAEGSFAELVRRYAPGIPVVAMLKELRAAEAIGDVEGNRLRVFKRHYIPRTLNDNLIRLWGSVLQDVGTTFEYNISRDDAEPPRFERRAITLRLNPAALPQFREMLEREGQSFLERIDDWMTAHEVNSTPDREQRGLRIGVGVYHIEDAPLRRTKRPGRGRGHHKAGPSSKYSHGGRELE